MITDDDLLLYYYRDGQDAAERARIGAALAEQPELAQRLHRLVGRLDAAAAMPEVPVPTDVMQRWQAALDQAAQRQTTAAPGVSKPVVNVRWLAAAAVLVVAIGSVIQITRQAPVPLTAETAVPKDANATQEAGASAYERGLKSHLENTERQLASFESATPAERARLIDTIVQQNRIYALAADRAGEPQLARVLRAFSPVLESLKSGSGDSSASVDQLAFEFRVMQGRLGAAPPSDHPSTTL